jgi:hypothetical protein
VNTLKAIVPTMEKAARIGKSCSLKCAQSMFRPATIAAISVPTTSSAGTTRFTTLKKPAMIGKTIFPLSIRVIWMVTSGKSVCSVEAGTFLKTFRKIVGTFGAPLLFFAAVSVSFSFLPSTASRVMRRSRSFSVSAAVLMKVS